MDAFLPKELELFRLEQLVELMKHTESEIKKMITSRGGLMAYLGTTDVRIVIKRIEEGDQEAELVLDAMIYNIAKEIGSMCVVLRGKVDAIVIFDWRNCIQ